jgi:hypothetical protein
MTEADPASETSYGRGMELSLFAYREIIVLNVEVWCLEFLLYILEVRDLNLGPVVVCRAVPFPVLSCPVLSCPVLPCPALPCPALSCPGSILSSCSKLANIHCGKTFKEKKMFHNMLLAARFRMPWTANRTVAKNTTAVWKCREELNKLKMDPRKFGGCDIST